MFEQRHNKITSLPPNTRPMPPLLYVEGAASVASVCGKKEKQRETTLEHGGGWGWGEGGGRDFKHSLASLLLRRHRRGSAAGLAAGLEVRRGVANFRSGRWRPPHAAVVSVFSLNPFLSEAR